MIPLAIMTVYGRLEETRRTLQSLISHTSEPLHLVIVDNTATATMRDMLRSVIFPANFTVNLELLDENIGCPRALNLAIANYRQPQQPVIKIDNDVEFLNDHWVATTRQLSATLRDIGRNVALVSGLYRGIFNGRPVKQEMNYGGWRVFFFAPIIGHAVWHDGAFMDTVGYFDVLAPGHLYGFEDLLMSHKASLLRYEQVAFEGWQIENIQRHSALGARETVDAHVQAMRPLYDDRVVKISSGGSLYCGPDGQPQ